MMSLLFVSPWGPIMEEFNILNGIFQFGIHQAQVLQATQARRESTQ